MNHADALCAELDRINCVMLDAERTRDLAYVEFLYFEAKRIEAELQRLGQPDPVKISALYEIYQRNCGGYRNGDVPQAVVLPLRTSDEANGIGVSRNNIAPERKPIKPPVNAEFLFYLLMTPQNCEAIVGDLEERYNKLHKRFGSRRANFWYWWQTGLSVLSLAWNWLKQIAGEYVSLLSDVIVHFVFLAAFAMLSVGLEKVVEQFDTHGFELIVLRTIQVVFGMATIGPTAIWLVRDLKALWERGQMEN